MSPVLGVLQTLAAAETAGTELPRGVNEVRVDVGCGCPVAGIPWAEMVLPAREIVVSPTLDEAIGTSGVAYLV